MLGKRRRTRIWLGSLVGGGDGATKIDQGERGNVGNFLLGFSVEGFVPVSKGEKSV